MDIRKLFLIIYGIFPFGKKMAGVKGCISISGNIDATNYMHLLCLI